MQLIIDGDLWEHLYEAIKTKGANSVRITGVKGHATQKLIDKGLAHIIDKAGDDKADEIADLGTHFLAKS